MYFGRYIDALWCISVYFGGTWCILFRCISVFTLIQSQSVSVVTSCVDFTQTQWQCEGQLSQFTSVHSDWEWDWQSHSNSDNLNFNLLSCWAQKCGTLPKPIYTFSRAYPGVKGGPVKVPGVINWSFYAPTTYVTDCGRITSFEACVRKVSFTSESSGNQNIWPLRL